MMHNQTKQHRYDQAYMKMAIEWGKLSYCNRKQVGALIVKDNMIISDGINIVSFKHDYFRWNKYGKF